jgi:hypothetical protein
MRAQANGEPVLENETYLNQAGIRAGVQRLRLLSVTGFPVSPRPQLVEFTVLD